MTDWGITQGARLKELRMKKGFSLEYIASKVGRSAPSICNYESGKRQPTDKVLHDLAFLYNVTVEEIMTGAIDATEEPYHIRMTPVQIDWSKPFVFGNKADAKSAEEEQKKESFDDSIDAFLREEIERVPDTVKDRIKRSELYDFYSVFCQNQEEAPFSKQTFYRAMRKKGFGEVKTSDGRMECFKGVRYKDRIPAELIAGKPADAGYLVSVRRKTKDLLEMMATLTGKTENEMLDIAVREYAQYVFDWNKALEGFCNGV